MHSGRQSSQPGYTWRTLESAVQSASEQFPVVLVTGGRQVGKTTLLQQVRSKERRYVTLDDPRLRELAREDPALLFQRFPPPVLVDEIQYAPQLLPFIKMEVDRSGLPGQFWLTGSRQFQLMKGVSESLAGRVGVLQLQGLTRRELLGQGPGSAPFLPIPGQLERRTAADAHLPLRELYRQIWRGNLPALALNDQTSWELFYGSYVTTYLQRDVRDLARVGDEMAFLRFLRAVAARTAQLLNVADLARDADVAPNTAKSWLSILQASGIIYLLEPYHTNLTKRLVKSPKLYLLDTGLGAYLTEWSSSNALEAGAMSGAILETWVVGELLRSFWHNGRRAPFYYYRDKDQVEIDLLILQDGTVYPLEIKKTASPGRNDIRHFQALDRLRLPIGPGGVICLADQSLPLTPSAVSIPVGLL